MDQPGFHPSAAGAATPSVGQAFAAMQPAVEHRPHPSYHPTTSSEYKAEEKQILERESEAARLADAVSTSSPDERVILANAEQEAAAAEAAFQAAMELVRAGEFAPGNPKEHQAAADATALAATRADLRVRQERAAIMRKADARRHRVKGEEAIRRATAFSARRTAERPHPRRPAKSSLEQLLAEMPALSLEQTAEIMKTAKPIGYSIADLAKRKT